VFALCSAFLPERWFTLASDRSAEPGLDAPWCAHQGIVATPLRSAGHFVFILLAANRATEAMAASTACKRFGGRDESREGCRQRDIPLATGHVHPEGSAVEFGAIRPLKLLVETNRLVEISRYAQTFSIIYLTPFRDSSAVREINPCADFEEFKRTRSSRHSGK
jgi:hypothetical protein